MKPVLHPSFMTLCNCCVVSDSRADAWCRVAFDSLGVDIHPIEDCAGNISKLWRVHLSIMDNLHNCMIMAEVG